MSLLPVISNIRLLILAVALLIVSGLSALSTLPRAEDPVIHNRYATVITHLPGATAERIEALITEKIETSLRQLDEVQLLTSMSRSGISVIQIELKDAITDASPVWSEARDKLTDVEPLLPPGASTPELDDDHGYAFTVITALTWQGDTEPDLLTLRRYAIEWGNRLRNLSGVEFVDTYGLVDEEILVSLDPAATSVLGRSAISLSHAINNADAKNAAGELVNGANRFTLEVSDALDSLDRVRRVPIAMDDNGYLIRLEDIATVQRQAAAPAAELAYIDGRPTVLVAARMQPSLRVDQWTDRVKALMAQFNADIPSNVATSIIFEQQGYTETRLSELNNSLLVGFSIILVVLFLTLGGRSALIVALSLPLTSLVTLAMMKFTGLPINQMSVTGLIVALGIMVDNAIVMVDTIAHYKQVGCAKMEAAIKAIQHLWVPLLGSTLTTVLAFAPIFLMPGPAGEFVGAIAITVCFSLLGSYLISHTLVAGFAARWLLDTTQGDKASEAKNSRWYQSGIKIPMISRRFEGSIALAIKHPFLTALIACALPFAGFWGAGQLTEQFFPPSDRDMFEIQLFLPPQASIYATTQATQEVDAIMAEFEDVEQISWLVGSNYPSFYYNLLSRQQGTPNFAQAMVKVRDFEAANRLIPVLQQQLDTRLPQAQILVRKLEQGPPFNAPLEVRVYGPNLDQLKTIGEEIRLIMAQTPDVTHTRETLQPGTPKVHVNVNEEASHLNSLSLRDVADLLQASFTGRLSGSIIEASESIPVRVRVRDEARENMDHLSSLPLPVTTSPNVAGLANTMPMFALADLSLTPSRGAIPRRNGIRVNAIEGYIRAGVLPQTALEHFQARLNDYQHTLPYGYTLEFGGESAERDESVGNLLANLTMVITLLVMVVVISFNSFRLSAIIFLVGFLASGLGLFSVWLFSYPFGFTVIIGVLGLVGLAINAAIVILAELKSSPAACQGDSDAILAGVMSCTRHITSTTITTVGGFMPLILAGGGFWPPFAITIAGGTALTTLLSFYFVPAAFRLIVKYRKLDTTASDTELATTV
ncbi:efflux RND transporter permease subunit [Photobacterium aphoticum]|uniref:Acriflavin resistance protein n=1 Tax=Photobacterium aphoticum TaxID=754436 RepID=A0A0J1GLA1_9GAMM|nr:efflux RND transporter permease subunit [Photobacterium aphoticum]KLV00396.1 acriflavin resistance protein [Photobacterium aphoticum]PSU59736.1 AcrB/AcrD/AcrF family protein [Photobacterium aphoticum]GHA42794.1 acriflavin resistance protein [Photobacterium aphoticum]